MKKEKKKKVIEESIKCDHMVFGKRCNFELIEVFLPEANNKEEVQYYCDNPKCSNYYICSCGKEFGSHYK